MKSICSLLLFLWLIVPVSAQQGEPSRILVHTLNYISHDYQFAVQDGKVISEAEYKEEEEFAEATLKYFHEFSGQWSDSDSVAIGRIVQRLDSLINHHAPFAEVSATAIDAKNRVVKASGLVITPSQYPNIGNGKIVFKTECAKCHGENGLGNGPEGEKLDPKPRNFHDFERMRSIAPFFAFNTIRLGIEGTGMRSHPTLEDAEVWDLAFYIATFPFQAHKDNAFLKAETTTAIVDSLSLNDVATKSDDELLKLLPAGDSAAQMLWLAAVRFHQPPHDKSEFINTSLKYLDGALELYMNKKYSEASQLAALAYLEGIEPIETTLKANDPALMIKLEGQMQQLRRMMEENRPVIEVKDSLRAVQATMKSAGELLTKKEYSFWLAFFMAASILFREGLEAFLVILVILSVLKAGSLKNAALWVHSGWLTAVGIGVILLFAGRTLMQHHTENLELTEGVISFIAVFMLLYVGFWLHGKSEVSRWKDYVSSKMKGAMTSKSLFGLAALSFFVVFREVFESVLFISALTLEAGEKQVGAITLGVFSAFALVIVLAALVLRFSTKLPVPTLFKISSFVMGLLAIVLAGKGAHSLQELGILGAHSLPVPRVELLGIFPTGESISIQILVFLVVAAIWKFGNSVGKK